MSVTATDILKQSFNFYGRLFNKVFWLSIASSLTPLLMLVASDGGKVNFISMLLTMAVSMFFSAYMMVMVHQFSQDQNDSLADAFRLTLQKVLPIAGTSIVFGIGAVLVSIPALIVGSILAAGIANEQLQAALVGLIIAIPLSFYLYRCFFSVYFTLVEGTTPFDALKASNKLIKKNTFIFRSFMLLSLIMLAYIAVITIVSLMVAVNPMARDILNFAINVIAMPYFTIFIYRLFVVSKDVFENDTQNSDLDADD